MKGHWDQIRNRILLNDGVSIDETGKIICSDIVEQIIEKCEFRYRYFLTFTFPDTRSELAGVDLDEFELTGRFIYFIRMFAMKYRNHLLPIWAHGIPPYKTTRDHIHCVLLAENPIDENAMKTELWMTPPEKIDFSELERKWFGEHYPKREPNETGREFQLRLTKHENEFKQKKREHKILLKNRFGNGQKVKHFEVYDRNRGGLSYILHKHVQWSSRVFCSGAKSCKNKGCKRHFPFSQLTPQEKNTMIIRSSSSYSKKVRNRQPNR